MDRENRRGPRLRGRFQVQLLARFLAIVALLAAAILLMVHRSISTQQLERTTRLLEQQAESHLAQLENRVATVQSDALSILSNSTIKEYLTYPYKKAALKTHDALYAFQPLVRWVLTINTQYRRIHFLTANETTSTDTFVSPLDDYLEADWVRSAMASPSHDHWINLHAPERFAYVLSPGEDVVTYVLYSSSGRHLVVMDASADWMFQGLPLVIDRPTGRVLFSTAAPEAVGSVIPGALSGMDTVDLLGVEYFVHPAVESGLNVLILVCEPKAPVLAETNARTRAFLLWELVSVLAAVALLAVTSNSVVRRMGMIRGNVSQITRGNYEVSYSASRGDEIDELGSDIVSMSRQMNQMVNQRLNQQMLLREAEFRALEQQINPHFIFNMLQTMQMIAEVNDQTELADMMAKFGRMVRYNLYATMNVPLSQELDNVRDYLILQKVLYNDELDVTIDMGRVPQTLEVPRLLLQPLVENAVNHGHIKGCVLHVRIEGVMERGMVRMTIRNDGKPLSPERETELDAVLEEVCRNPGSVDGGNARENLALINIQKRMLIRFGAACRLRIHNGPDGGVEVTLTLPIGEELP